MTGITFIREPLHTHECPVMVFIPSDRIERLIRDAIACKNSSMAWQAKVQRRDFKPYSEQFCRECAAFWQKRLVELLTLIIGGDEATLAREGTNP